MFNIFANPRFIETKIKRFSFKFRFFFIIRVCCMISNKKKVETLLLYSQLNLYQSYIGKVNGVPEKLCFSTIYCMSYMIFLPPFIPPTKTRIPSTRLSVGYPTDEIWVLAPLAFAHHNLTFGFLEPWCWPGELCSRLLSLPQYSQSRRNLSISHTYTKLDKVRKKGNFSISK